MYVVLAPAMHSGKMDMPPSFSLWSIESVEFVTYLLEQVVSLVHLLLRLLVTFGEYHWSLYVQKYIKWS
jgi:hypothetical protein